MTRLSHRNRAIVNRMKRPKADAPTLATAPSGRAKTMAPTAATHANARQARRARRRAEVRNFTLDLAIIGAHANGDAQV